MEGFIISSIVCCIMYLANRGASVRKYEQIEYEKKEKIKSEEKNKIEIDLKDIAFKNEN